MKKLFLIFILSSSLFSAHKLTLQLSWLHQFQFAGYYAAKELGYYQDAGIEIEIKPFGSGIELSSVLENKQADFAIGRSSLLIDKINGKDVVALGAIFQQSPMMLLVRDDTGINSVNDLKGKRIMLTNAAKESASIMAMLFSHGLVEKDIQIIPHSFNLDDLIEKKTDAMACYTSNEPIRMQDRGIAYKIFHPKDYGFPFYSDILFTSSKFINKNPKLTRKFYEASIKGWEYAFNNITQTAELIHKHYNPQNKTLVQLIKEGEALKRLAYYKGRQLGYLDSAQLRDIIKVYKLLGMLKTDVDLDRFIYEHNHPKELVFSLSYDEIFYITIISVLALVLFSSFLLFISLRKDWLLTKNDLKMKIDEQKDKLENQNSLLFAQSKMAAVGEMLSGIAHQWRQPLNIISLNTVKIETAVLLGNTMEKDALLQISEEINQQSQYLSQTIDDFRNYFTPGAEDVEKFYVKDTIAKLNSLTHDIFDRLHIKTVITTQDCSIEHKESILVQALLNIYNNAKDALTQNNENERYFFIDVQCDKKNIYIALKDSGGGMDKEVMTRVFDPYYTTKHKSQGTGLGLYISYEIITKQYRGTIEVHNRDYDYHGLHLKGAEFIITLPLNA